ncbi:MAG TPA: thiamine pyrophosphate-dependent enzyme [Flavisolibacter sp.]
MDRNLLLHTYRLMYTAKVMAETYEANRQITKYVHSTSRGHEAIQLATAFNLQPQDWVSPYYRDESLLLGLGWTPYELMLQLLTRADDPFSGGRSYYSHPNSSAEDKPKIIHQSSATGMQVIPTTGIAQGIQYLEGLGSENFATTQSSTDEETELKSGSPISEVIAAGGSSHREESEMGRPIVLCSLGDASVTEGEVSEAFQFAVLKQLPIIYLVQDNDWGISVTAEEGRAMNAYRYAKGFKGMKRVKVDGTDFFESYKTMHKVVEKSVKNGNPTWCMQKSVCLIIILVASERSSTGARKTLPCTQRMIRSQNSEMPLLAILVKTTWFK